MKQTKKQIIQEWYDSNKGKIDWHINECRSLFRQTYQWKDFQINKKLECEICKTSGHLSLHHHLPEEYDNLDPILFSTLCLHCHRKVENWSERQDKSNCPDFYIPHLAKSIKMRKETILEWNIKKDLSKQIYWCPETDEYKTKRQFSKQYKKLASFSKIAGADADICDKKDIRTTTNGKHFIFADGNEKETLQKVLDLEVQRIEKLREKAIKNTTKEYKENMSKKLKGMPSKNKNKTYEELYGIEKAEQLKQLRREAIYKNKKMIRQ